MAQTTWYVNKDTRVARRQSDNLDQGAGASVALPFGYYSGYIYRAYLGFAHNITDLNIIDKAVLWLRTSDQYYVAFGSDPDLNVALLDDEAWSEGSSVGLSTGNATVYGDVGYLPELVQKDVTTAINTWVSIDITDLIRDAKATGSAGFFNGLQLSSTGTGSSDVGEFWAREKGTSYRAYIVVDYTNNRAPNAPTLTSPASSTKYASTAVPTFKFTGSDPDTGDTQQAFQIEVSTSSGFGSFVWQSGWSTTGQTGFSVSRVYAGGALTPGTTYYWRARTRDAALLEGPWSAARSFIINALPIVSDANLPYAKANHVAPIHNLADRTATTLTPKPQFTFKPTATDGEAITGYQVEISGQAVEEVLGSWASGTSITHKSVRALTNLTSYTVRFRVKDAFEGYGPWSSYTTFAVKYMQAIYQYNLAGGNGLKVTLGTITGTAVVSYRTATGASGAGAGSWSASVPSTVPAYLNIMVRLSGSGTAPAQPKMTSLRLDYYLASVLPVAWAIEAGDVGWAVDESVRKYGTKSLVGQGQPTDDDALFNQVIDNLAPDTDYVASVWVLIEDYTGDAAPADGIGLLIADMSFGTIKHISLNRDTNGWERIVVPFRTGSESSVRFILRIDNSVTPTTIVHFDAAMVNEGNVAPPWTPSLVGIPGIVDTRGVVLDGANGAIFRVFNNAGQPIEMGSVGPGIDFGEDIRLWRDTTSRLAIASLGATAPRIGLQMPSGHEVLSYGYFVWNVGDSIARAALGKHSAGQGALHFGPGNAATDVILFRDSATVLGINAGMKIGVGGSYQSIQMFSGGTINGGTMLDHGTGGSEAGRIIQYNASGTAYEILRWDATTGGRIGFYGAAPANVVGRQTVSGSRGANAALTSLLTALHNLGLINNTTT